MKVLIVAKTRQGGGACIGGITFEGKSVRLIAANAATDERAGMEYAVGEVWEIEGAPPESVIPPHVENIVVRSKRRLGPMTDPTPFIEKHMPPKIGGVDLLYEGLLRSATTGALYVAESTGIPPYSTTFWRPDQPLARVDDGKRIRYRYPTADGGRTLVFVGFQEPVELIPAGALLRVSLAHWCRPNSDPNAELRCYVQLSGWFLAKGLGIRDQEPGIRSQETGGIGQPSVVVGRSSFVSGQPSPVVGRSSSVPLADAHRLLKTVFGYDAFRPLQAEIITNILARRDTLAIMPTGSGKSLCFQLPSLLFDGLTVVISPLISLMQDQVDQVAELGVPAAFLNSTLDYADYLATTRRVKAGEIKLLYTSPETLLRPETLVMLDRSRVDCLAIDEAHCISQLGHDFRPEYRQLLPVRTRYAAAVCVAFTATATPRVRRDIGESLGFRAEDAFIASFNRENLFLEVRSRTDGPAQTLAFLAAHRDQSGIIYCSTRRQVDALTAQLAAQGWPVLPYHAGLDAETSRRNQAEFSRDRVPIIVATIAFGMGINKSNVRFVLHYNLPESLEGYYQEIGRAGRDGLRADCLLLFSRADLGTIYQFIEEGAESERAGRHARLQAMVRYAEAEGCRRALLLDYFGETLPSTTLMTRAEDGCGFCDTCLAAKGEVIKEDASAAAQQFLDCVAVTGQRFGAGHVIDVLRGSRDKDVLRWHHDRLPIYGAGKEITAKRWRHLAEQFIRLGLVEQEMAHGSLRLTAKGEAARGGAAVLVTPEALPPTPAAAEMPAYDAELFSRLRVLRREIADAENLPPYVIFSDRSLVEMATYFPQSSFRFLAIHGVGERKLAQHGERFLAAIRAYCAERGLAERSKPVETVTLTRASTGEKNRSAEVGELFAAGQSVASLQELYGVKQQTITEHLGRCVQAGQTFPAERILPLSRLSAEDQNRVLAALAEHGPERLKPIFDAVGGVIAYEELAVMRLYYLCAAAGPE